MSSVLNKLCVMQAFRVADEAAAAAAASQQKSVAADAAEVARVLAARSHLDCLQLPLNSTRDALKRKYKAMAVALHPDKCKVGPSGLPSDYDLCPLISTSQK